MTATYREFESYCTVIDSLRAGGAEKLVLTVHRYLARDWNVRPPVVTLYPGGQFEEQARAAGVRVVSLGDYRRMPAFEWIRRFRSFLAQESPAVVHGHLFPVSYLLWASTSLIRHPPKVLFTEHNVHNRRRGYRLVRPLEKRVYSRFAKVICVSEEVKNRLVEWLPWEQENTVVINNCVEVSEMPSDARQPRVWDCVAVGSLTAQKAHTQLVEAVALLRDEGIDLQVAIAGEGPLREELEAAVKALGLAGSVHLLGHVGSISTLLESTRLFIMPSRYEGHPMAVLEAMVAGLPIVATRVGGLSDIVRHGETGVLVEPDSPHSLAQAIAYTLADEGTARALGCNGRRWVEQNGSVPRHLQSLSAIIRQLG